MSFNAELLMLARQSRGLSQSELASDCQLSQAMISKLENGLGYEPSIEVITKLSSILKYPAEFFYETDRVYGLPASVHSGALYRRKANVTKKSREKLEAILNMHIFHLRRLVKSIDLDFDLPLPQYNPDIYTPEEIAKKVRQSWLMPKGPIPNLMDYVERAGCMVFLCDFDGLAVDGVTMRDPSLPPCIFLNKNLPGCRQRFTLAHELGHVIMHSVPTGEDMENEANEFAGSLLMPMEDIKPFLAGSKLTISKLGQLKLMWLSSMGAILHRAKAIAAITPNQYKYLCIEMNKYGFKSKEPIEYSVMAETSANVKEIISIHTEDLEYSIQDMESLLKSTNDDLYHMYGIGINSNRPKLRIV